MFEGFLPPSWNIFSLDQIKHRTKETRDRKILPKTDNSDSFNESLPPKSRTMNRITNTLFWIVFLIGEMYFWLAKYVTDWWNVFLILEMCQEQEIVGRPDYATGSSVIISESASMAAAW